MRTGEGATGAGTARRAGAGTVGTALATGGIEFELGVGLRALLRLRPMELKLLDGVAVEPAAGSLALMTLASTWERWPWDTKKSMFCWV